MRRIYPYLVWGVCLWIFAGHALTSQSFFENGQPPRFGLLDRSAGMTSLSISSIQQDRDGFIWFGTQGGLERYDGKNLVTFTHDPFDSNSIPNDLVQTLYYEEGTNTLWIGTYNGLSGMDVDSCDFVHYQRDAGSERGLSNNIVVAITTDNQDRLWVGTMEGLNRIDRSTGIVELIETAHPTVRSLLVDSGGRLWVGTYGGLQYWDDKAGALVAPQIELPSDFVMSVKEPQPGRLLLGMWGGGVAEYWPETNRLTVHQVPDDRIYTVLESSDGTLWAGSWGGGLWARPTMGEAVWFKDSSTSELANPIVYSLFEDKGGLVWLGTNGGGVHYLSPRRSNYRIASHDTSRGSRISEGKIDVIHRDPRGDLILGISGQGLNIIDGETGEVTFLSHDPENPNSLGNDTVNEIITDDKGHLWIAHNAGVDRYDRETGRFEGWGDEINPHAPLSNTIISALYQDRAGRFWFGTYGSGIDVYDPDTDRITNYQYDPEDPDTLSDNTVYSFLETDDGAMWVSTNHGLNRFNPDSGKFIRYFHRDDDFSSLSGNNVRQLFEDSRGRLWVGTYSAGLNSYHRETDSFTHFTTRDGISSNNVLAILEGDDRRIWISTRGGINAIDPETNDIEVIDERSGLFGVFFNYGSHKDDDGSLYFGGSHGVTMIDSHINYENMNKPDVHIMGISVMGRPLEKETQVYDGGTYYLKPGENYLTFDFIALDFEAPGHNRYAHIMEGADKQQVMNGNRNYATYTYLKPGKYRFKVTASNNDGLWNEEGAWVNIVVLAPWYRKWWALGLYILLVLLIFYGIMKARDARVLARTNALLERANSDLETLTIHDSLTGLFNRRYFDSHLEEEVRRAHRDGVCLSLLMIDIDRFKDFNDTYGHLAGDKALEQIARCLENAVSRNTDFITRYGGEEFCIVLYDTDGEGAGRVADQIHNYVRSQPVILRGEEIGLTVSIGIHSSVPAKEEYPEELIRLADKALYRAKEKGRNRTETEG